MNALVVGGSGLVGKELLQQLSKLSSVATVISVGRSPLPFPTPANVEHRVIDLFGPLPADIQPDVLFCSLGTTIKDAGSKEAFWKIDHDLPLHLAREARLRGAGKCVIVSSMGANPDSRVYYSMVKGVVENDLEHLRFDGLSIIRPSLLLGDRRHPRIGEEVASLILQTFRWLIPRKWRPVRASAVAAVMILMARRPPNGTEMVLNDDIQRLTEGHDANS